MTLVTFGGGCRRPASLAAVSERFDWSPEPELIDVREEARSRAALEALGEQTWREALDWLYGEAMRRPMHVADLPRRAHSVLRTDEPRRRLRRCRPARWSDVLAEFRERIAPATYNAQHPGSFSYFTPPPLPSSIAGDMLAQWIHQGVDVWHAGPIGTFVEEEVTDWLRELVGFGADGWGVLTSGGVMANLMAMTVARDVWLAKLRGHRRRSARRRPRGRARVRERPDPLLDRPRARGARLPRTRRWWWSRATSGSGCTPRPWPRRSSATARPGSRRSRSRPSRARRTPDRSTTQLGSPTSPSARACGCTSTPPTAAPRGCRRRDAHRVPGLERAESVTVDPHKWFFQAYDIGALVVRRREDLLSTFHSSPEYYASSRPEDEPLNWYQYSLEGTRRFRALKLWMSWKQVGTAGSAS